MYLTFISAMFLTMAMIPPLMRCAARLKIVDVPDQRKIHAGAIPRIGGIAIVVGALLSIMLWIPHSRVIDAFILGSLVIFLFGVLDDRWELDYKIKFGGQLIAIVIIVFYGDVRIMYLPGSGLEPVPMFVSIPLTVFVLLGVINAINLTDGLDGLAGGSTLLSLGLMGIIAYQIDELVVISLTIAVIGSVLGFLRYNTHPARVFMGDSGSQFLGFAAGILAILLTQDENASISCALPLLFLGLPILDTLMVMGQRIMEGRSPFKPDRNHIHHQLLTLGLDHYEAVFLIYAVQACLVTLAYYLRHQSDALILLIYGGFCALVLLFFYVARRRRWSFQAGTTTSRGRDVFKSVLRFRDSGKLARLAYLIAVIVLPIYLFGGALSIQGLTPDMMYMILGVACLLVLFLFTQKNRPVNWLERAGIYVTAAVVVYLSLLEPQAWFSTAMWVLAAILAATVIAAFFFSREITFAVTPLDFLIVFMVLSVPNLPGLEFDQQFVSRMLLQLIVVFYGTELVLAHTKSNVKLLRAVPVALLVVILVKTVG